MDIGPSQKPKLLLHELIPQFNSFMLINYEQFIHAY